jgi:hypothetical protein
LEPRSAGSDGAEDNGFLRMIKICSTTSFGWEVKLSVPCRKTYFMLKNLTSMKEILRRQNSAAISCQVSPASLLDVSADNLQRALVEESGMIKNNMGTQQIRNGRGARVAMWAHPM